MLKQINHIGVAVRSVESSNVLFGALFNNTPFHEEIVVSQQVKVSFFALGDTLVELLEPVSEQSPIYKFIENKGEGIHHVAFETDDIYAEMERMKAEGFKPLSEQPYVGALNKLVCFFHPKTTNGVLVELCQKQH